MDFRGKRAVIIGSGNGMGRALALALAKAGAASIHIGDIDIEGAEETAAKVRALGAEAATAPCDLGSDESVADFANRTFADGAHVDLLFNHAGVSLGGMLEMISSEDWHWLLNINIVGTGRVIRNFVPRMSTQGSGWIINTSSGLGLFHDLPAGAPYIATKAAIIAYSRAFATYVRNRGIGVSVFCPDLTATAFAGGGRLVGIPAELAPALMAVSEIQSPEDAVACLMAGLEREDFLISAVPATHERLAAMTGAMFAPGSDRATNGKPMIQMVRMRFPTENVAEAGAIFADFAKIAREHSGCIAYEPGIDPANPTRFVLCEAWRDIESHDAHAMAPESFGLLARLMKLGASDFAVERPSAQ